MRLAVLTDGHLPVPLLKHHFCRRAEGKPKAHAHAAYLSGTKLEDGTGHTADFTPKGGILHAELWVPKEAPSWAKDRGRLWKELEAREDRSTRKAKAILAHKFIGALPCELSLEENIRYIKDYVREQFTRKGYAIDWAIHAPDPGSDSRNTHVHIMVPLRRFENGDWANKKDRFPKNSPALSLYIKEKQEAFFSLQNRYLQKNGIQAQIIRQNGKWAVVEDSDTTTHTHPGAKLAEANYIGPTSLSPICTSLSLQPAQSDRGWEVHALPQVTRPQPTAKPSYSPSLGGGHETHTQQKMLGRYSEIVRHHSFINPSTRSWPTAAIADWKAWGHKETARFFRKWPELATGNPAPGREF